MNLTKNEARPPYVSFGLKTEEDRAASLAAGHIILRDVHYAFITPHGSKDRHEKRVEDWFPVIDQAVREERMPQEWVNYYKAAYAAWKAGEEIPLTGTPLRNWPLLTPAQIENCKQFKVLTVEDLAASNEETIMRLGIGGRGLVDKAKNYLQAQGSDASKLTQTLTALQTENAQLKGQVEQMDQVIKVMQAQLQGLGNVPQVAVEAPAGKGITAADLLEN